MLTLIRREIKDDLSLFLLASGIAVGFGSVMLWLGIDKATHSNSPYSCSSSVFEGLVLVLPCVLSVLAVVMGAAQMYRDRHRRISSFLSTLPTTRGQILTARMVTGALAILIALGPIAVAITIMFRIFYVPPIRDVYVAFFTKVFLMTFLLSVACYCLGLLMGWGANLFVPVCGTLILLPVLVSVVVIKGLHADSMVILLAFIVALVTRTWLNFRSTSL